MRDKSAKSLLEKYKTGKCTPEEKIFVENYIIFIENSESDLTEKELEAEISELRFRIGEMLPAQRPLIKLWRYIAAAASIILITAGGLFYFNYQHTKPLVSDIAENRVISSGKNKATLTLANGRRIILSDAVNGELVKESGISVSKTADGQILYEVRDQHAAQGNKMNTLSTSRGETYQVRLPDGTAVWLNAASSLKYPMSFAALKDRKVELTGEAYFEVAKDKVHPFIVRTDKQEVKVLGTHFNINSYANEPAIKTTLLEGSVEVTALTAARIVKKINAGQETVLKNNAMEIVPVDVESAVAWKNGTFNFNNKSILDIMTILERWYDIEVQYEGQPTDEVFYGEISRHKNINQVLKMLERTNTVHFKIAGRRVVVTK
jgi:transmembrane sensor